MSYEQTIDCSNRLYLVARELFEAEEMPDEIRLGDVDANDIIKELDVIMQGVKLHYYEAARLLCGEAYWNLRLPYAPLTNTMSHRIAKLWNLKDDSWKASRKELKARYLC